MEGVWRGELEEATARGVGTHKDEGDDEEKPEERAQVSQKGVETKKSRMRNVSETGNVLKGI